MTDEQKKRLKELENTKHIWVHQLSTPTIQEDAHKKYEEWLELDGLSAAEYEDWCEKNAAHAAELLRLDVAPIDDPQSDASHD